MLNTNNYIVRLDYVLDFAPAIEEKNSRPFNSEFEWSILVLNLVLNPVPRKNNLLPLVFQMSTKAASTSRC